MQLPEIEFTATIRKIGQQGEKTGWTVIDLPAALANILQPDAKTSFKVKGTIDGEPINQLAAIPIGEGDYVLPLNAALRKKMGLRPGIQVACRWQKDGFRAPLSASLMACLQDAPEAYKAFQQLPPSHQRYYSRWVEEAKTDQTKGIRIAKCIAGLERSLSFGDTTRLP